MSTHESQTKLARGGPTESMAGRPARAREEPMVVLPQADHTGDATGIYEVITDGDVYTVDLQTGSCSCPDFRFNAGPNGDNCKHLNRVAIEINEGDLPATDVPVAPYQESLDALEAQLSEDYETLRSLGKDEEAERIQSFLKRIDDHRSDLEDGR